MFSSHQIRLMWSFLYSLKELLHGDIMLFYYLSIYSKLRITRMQWDPRKNPSYVKIRVMWNVYEFTSIFKDKIVATKQTSFLWKSSSEKPNLRMNEYCPSLRMIVYLLYDLIPSFDEIFAYEITIHVWTDSIYSRKKTVTVSIFFHRNFA